MRDTFRFDPVQHTKDVADEYPPGLYVADQISRMWTFVHAWNEGIDRIEEITGVDMPDLHEKLKDGADDPSFHPLLDLTFAEQMAMQLYQHQREVAFGDIDQEPDPIDLAGYGVS